MEKVQFKYLWITVLLGMLSVFIVYFINFSEFKEAAIFYKQNENNFGVAEFEYSFIQKNIHIILYAIVLCFVGLEVKNLKAGIAGALTYFIISALTPYIFNDQILQMDWIWYFHLGAPIVSVFVFSLFTHLTILKKAFLSIFGGSLLKGIPLFIQYIFFEFDLTVVGKILEVSMRHKPIFKMSIGSEENGSIERNMNYLFELIFSLPLIYIYLILLFWLIVKIKSIKGLNNISLDFHLPKFKTIVVHLYSHFGIILAASGIFYWLANRFNVRYIDYVKYPEKVNHFYFFIGLGIICVLTFAILFRNFMLSFFLSHEKKISWNYFFCQVLFIGPIIWLVNVLNWRQPEKLNKTKMKFILEHDDVNIKFAFLGIYGLFFILRVAAMMQQDSNLNLWLVVIDFTFLCMFVFYRFGIYILILIKSILFIGILYISTNAELFDTRNASAITGNYFYAIAFLCLIYPVFFMDSFRVLTVKENSL